VGKGECDIWLPDEEARSIGAEVSRKALEVIADAGRPVYDLKKHRGVDVKSVAREIVREIGTIVGLEFSLKGVDKLFDKVMKRVPLIRTVLSEEELESLEEDKYICFVAVHPKNYRKISERAGAIAVTAREELELDHTPLVLVRNDLCLDENEFGVLVLHSSEVVQSRPEFDVEVLVGEDMKPTMIKLARFIASTVATRTGHLKFPYVMVKESLLVEEGEFRVRVKFTDSGAE